MGGGGALILNPEPQIEKPCGQGSRGGPGGGVKGTKQGREDRGEERERRDSVFYRLFSSS